VIAPRVGHSGQRHRELQLRTEHFQHAANARFARRGETPQVRSTDEHRPGAERQRLENVGATSDPSVEEKGTRPATWSAMSGRASIVAIAPSCCRPP
jgi:hypothetical protein